MQKIRVLSAVVLTGLSVIALTYLIHPLWLPQIDGAGERPSKSDHAHIHIHSHQVGGEATTAMVGGQIMKIDLAEGKITIHHDAIKGGMASMTMVYDVASPQLLKGLMVEERIQFSAIQDKGKWTVTTIRRDICEQ